MMSPLVGLNDVYAWWVLSHTAACVLPTFAWVCGVRFCVGTRASLDIGSEVYAKQAFDIY